MKQLARRKQNKKADNGHDQKGARPFWSGTLTFGLVSVPVDLYPGNRTSRAPLRMLGPNGTDEELERLAPEQSRDIDLRRFVPREDLPPVYFDRSYFLAPGRGAEKAYRLLTDTIEKEKLAGVATFVMRGKEYLVAIFPEHGILRAETMRFADEVRAAKEIDLPEKKKLPAATVRKFAKLIEKHSHKQLSLKELKDEQTEKLLKLVEKKRKQHKDIVEVEAPARDEGKVVDLMAALKKRLASKRKAAA